MGPKVTVQQVKFSRSIAILGVYFCCHCCRLVVVFIVVAVVVVFFLHYFFSRQSSLPSRPFNDSVLAATSFCRLRIPPSDARCDLQRAQANPPLSSDAVLLELATVKAPEVDLMGTEAPAPVGFVAERPDVRDHEDLGVVWLDGEWLGLGLGLAGEELADGSQ